VTGGILHHENVEITKVTGFWDFFFFAKNQKRSQMFKKSERETNEQQLVISLKFDFIAQLVYREDTKV